MKPKSTARYKHLSRFFGLNLSSVAFKVSRQESHSLSQFVWLSFVQDAIILPFHCALRLESSSRRSCQTERSFKRAKKEVRFFAQTRVQTEPRQKMISTGRIREGCVGPFRCSLRPRSRDITRVGLQGMSVFYLLLGDASTLLQPGPISRARTAYTTTVFRRSEMV